MSNRGDFGTPLCVLISATLITEERDAKHNPQESIPSQGFPCCQLFDTNSIFIFDMRFVLRNDCTCVSSEAQVIWALGAKALRLHVGFYFCLLAFKIRERDSSQAEDRTGQDFAILVSHFLCLHHTGNPKICKKMNFKEKKL